MLYVNALDLGILEDTRAYLAEIGAAQAVQSGAIAVWVQWRIPDSGGPSTIVERFRLQSTADSDASTPKRISVDFTSAECISRFVTHCRKRHREAKTLFVFHSHGEGTGGLGAPKNLRTLARTKMAESRRVPEKNWDLISLAPKMNGEISPRLTLVEIGKGLAPTGGRRKLDVVMFSACFMALIEVAYQLRGACDHVVAGEGVVYSTLTGHLFEKFKKQTPAGLCKEIVKNYQSECLRRNLLPPMVYSAVAVKKMVSVVNAIRDMSSMVLSADEDNQQCAIEAFHSACLEAGLFLGPNQDQFHADIAHFSKILARDAECKKLGTHASRIRKLAKNCVIAHVADEDFKSCLGANGIAIYCPLGRGSREPLSFASYCAPNNLTFVRDTRWGEVLRIALNSKKNKGSS